MTNQRLQGKPKKLRDDTWGAFVEGRPAPGECITMTSQRGKSWDAYVGKVIWQGPEGAVVTTERRDDSRGPRRGRTDAGGINEAPNSEPPPNDWADEKDYRSS